MVNIPLMVYSELIPQRFSILIPDQSESVVKFSITAASTNHRFILMPFVLLIIHYFLLYSLLRTQLMEGPHHYCFYSNNLRWDLYGERCT